MFFIDGFVVGNLVVDQLGALFRLVVVNAGVVLTKNRIFYATICRAQGSVAVFTLNFFRDFNAA